MRTSATAALAYAMWDAENSTRLERPVDQQEYFARASRLLGMIKRYRPRRERLSLAAEIRKAHRE